MREGWNMEKLGSHCKTSAGSTPLKSKSEYYENGKIPWLRSGEVGNKAITKAKIKITELALEETSVKMYPEDSVLIAMYGATAGEVGILRFPSTSNQAVCAIYPSKKFVPEFLYYFFLHFKSDLVAQAVGNAQPNISQAKIKNTLIPIIDVSEQKKIVALLDQSFAAINQAKVNIERNIENAKELFQSKLNAIFSQRGEGWDEKKLSEICENLDSRRIPITKNKRVAGDIPYYGASGIVDYVKDYLFDEDLLLVSEDGANLLARTYPIAFSISGKNWVNNHAHVLRFESMTSQTFVEFYLNSIKLDKYVSGMAQPKLNQRMLNSILIPFPKIDEQKKIVTQIGELQRLKKNISKQYDQKLNSLEELKKSILQKVFSGELTE